MRVFNIVAIIGILFLSSCSGPPLKLKKTVDRSMKIMSSEMSNITEFENYLEPIMLDSYKVSEDTWCFTYEIGHLLYFSTLWQKQDSEWVKTELRPYEENCNWAR
jgi:hypothetical protein